MHKMPLHTQHIMESCQVLQTGSSGMQHNYVNVMIYDKYVIRDKYKSRVTCESHGINIIKSYERQVFSM